MKKNSIVASLAFIMMATVGVMVPPAYGRGDDDTRTETATETESSASGLNASGSLQTFEQNKERERRIAEQREKLIKAREESKTKKEERVLNAKQKVCQNREAEIKAALTRISQRSTNHIAVFNKISERVKAFYVQKRTVLENYDQLVANVDSTKAVAEAAVVNLTSIADLFTCDIDNPQASIQAVRDALHAKRDAMKAYKTAVKNLIVGVKSVQPSSSSNDSQENQQ